MTGQHLIILVQALQCTPPAGVNKDCITQARKANIKLEIPDPILEPIAARAEPREREISSALKRQRTSMAGNGRPSFLDTEAEAPSESSEDEDEGDSPDAQAEMRRNFTDPRNMDGVLKICASSHDCDWYAQFVYPNIMIPQQI